MFEAKGRRFALDESELKRAHLGIKLVGCPRCGRIGALIGHGWLTGYAEREQGRVVRGRRFFCSNRYRRPGCGRTFSMLLVTLIAGFVVRALTLWSFVEQVVVGVSRRAAWATAAGDAFSISSAYRLWRRAKAAEISLRARLCRECAPPGSVSDEPLAELLAHFRAAVPDIVCSFSGYQLRLQEGLFG